MLILQESIKQFIFHCSKERRLSESTVKAYSFDLKHFYSFLAKEYPDVITVDQINKNIIMAYVSDMNLNYSVKTVKRKIATLRGFFLYYEEEYQIQQNPFDKLHIKLKEPFVMPEVMSLREIKKILTAAYSCPTGSSPNTENLLLEFLHFRDIAVLEFLFATGIRVHELCNLKFSDFDKKKSVVKIFGKGQKERRIYIGNPEVLAALNTYLNCAKAMKYKSEYIFLNKLGKQLSPQAVRNLVTKYTNLAHIKKNITPHVFRHSFATLLLEEGVDVKYIQEFLGHSSISTTQIYLHISNKTARKVLKTKHPRKNFSVMPAMD